MIVGLAETIFSLLILLTFTLAYRIVRMGGAPYQPTPSGYPLDLAAAANAAAAAWCWPPCCSVDEMVLRQNF